MLFFTHKNGGNLMWELRSPLPISYLCIHIGSPWLTTALLSTVQTYNGAEKVALCPQTYSCHTVPIVT